MVRYPFNTVFIPARIIAKAFLYAESAAKNVIVNEPQNAATRELYWIVLGRLFRRRIEAWANEQ